MLQSIKSGKTQLPDFQRGWIWDGEHIKSLLASISFSYPIGAVMMLQTGNAEVRGSNLALLRVLRWIMPQNRNVLFLMGNNALHHYFSLYLLVMLSKQEFFAEKQSIAGIIWILRKP